jgi:hypothetical protein
MTPAWILDIFAALMLVVAAVSAARLVAARPWRRVAAVTGAVPAGVPALAGAEPAAVAFAAATPGDSAATDAARSRARGLGPRRAAGSWSTGRQIT